MGNGYSIQVELGGIPGSTHSHTSCSSGSAGLSLSLSKRNSREEKKFAEVPVNTILADYMFLTSGFCRFQLNSAVTY